MSPDITLHIQPSFQVEGRPRCFSGTPFAIKVQRILDFKALPYRVREAPTGSAPGCIARTQAW